MGGGGPDIPDQQITRIEPPGYIAPYLTDAAKRTEQLGKIPQEIYPEQMYVGPNMYQDMAAASRLAYGTSPAMFGQIGQSMATQNEMLRAPDVADNPYIASLKAMNERRTMDRFERQTVPGIEDQFQAAGQLGSSRQGVREALAYGEAERGIQDYNAQVDAAAYESGLAQQAKGMAFVPQTMGLGYMPADAYGGFGDYINREAEMALAERMQRFDFPQQEPWDRLTRELGLYSTMPGSTQVASGGGSGASSNPLMGALGLGLGAYSLFGGGLGGAGAMAGGLGGLGGASFLSSGAGAAAPLAGGMSLGTLMAMGAPFSDRRLKENIEALTVLDGVQWYTFDYKDPERHGHGRHIGVMADEIEDRFPDAVHVDAAGYRHVDYTKVMGTAHV